MDQVQGWLSSGNNGREKPEEGQGHKEDKIVKSLVEKLNQKDKQENVKPGGGIQPYLDDGLDLPGLEVQSIKSDQNYDMTNCNGDRQAFPNH